MKSLYFIDKIESIFNESVENVFASVSGMDRNFIRKYISDSLNEQIGNTTIRRMCQDLGVKFISCSFRRASNKGKHQELISRVFGMPFVAFIDKAIWSSLGFNVFGGDIFITDLFDFIDDVCNTIYGKGRARMRKKRVMRHTILKALGERSIELGMWVHLDPRFPVSLLRYPHE